MLRMYIKTNKKTKLQKAPSTPPRAQLRAYGPACLHTAAAGAGLHACPNATNAVAIGRGGVEGCRHQVGWA